MKNLTDFKSGDRVRILDVEFVRDVFRGLTGTVIEVICESNELIEFEVDETPDGYDGKIFVGSTDSFEHYTQEVDADLSASIEQFIDEF